MNLSFIFGAIAGIIVTAAGIWIRILVSQESKPSGVSFFKKTGKVFGKTNCFQVTQVLNDEFAIASEVEEKSYSYDEGRYYEPTGTMVLMYSKHEFFYDRQIVKNPPDFCFKQVGLYTQNKKAQPIPIIKLSKK